MTLKSKVTDFLETINYKEAVNKPALLKVETGTWVLLFFLLTLLLLTFLPLANPTLATSFLK